MIKVNELLLKAQLTVIISLFFSITINAQYDSIFYGGYNRTYLLHLPADYSKSNTFPLIIAMHGGLGSASNIQSQSQLSVKADKESFIVVYPEGVKGGALNVRTWNAGWCCGFASDSNIDDVGFINALLDSLIDKYSIDTNRIYATGMSNGGFMTYRLACELSGRIAAIAPVAASMSITNCTPGKTIPIIHFHSYLDTNVPYKGGIGNGISSHYNSPLDSVLNAWAGKNSCGKRNDTIINNNQYTYIRWNSCNCEAEIRCYITQDGGHSWPGGNQTAVGDAVSKYISATDSMWLFFKKYSLNCATTTVNKSTKPDNFELFPNPTNGIIHISKSESMIGSAVTVYNNVGQAILKSENKETIDLTYQPNGIYYISIQTKGNIVTDKVIKN